MNDSAFIPPILGQSATKLIGIGAVLDTNATGKVVIRDVIVGSPAEKSGLTAQDIIVAVRAQPLAEMIPVQGKSMPEVLSLIRGPLGVSVILKIERNGAESIVTVVREEVMIRKQ